MIFSQPTDLSSHWCHVAHIYQPTHAMLLQTPMASMDGSVLQQARPSGQGTTRKVLPKQFCASLLCATCTIYAESEGKSWVSPSPLLGTDLQTVCLFILNFKPGGYNAFF